jgi:hypothetical protein
VKAIIVNVKDGIYSIKKSYYVTMWLNVQENIEGDRPDKRYYRRVEISGKR